MWKRNRKSELENINLLDLKPVRVASWRDVDERVILERPRPQRGLRSLLEWITYALSTRYIRLDEVGSYAWRHFDGQRTVSQVAEALRRDFGERVEPTEERLGHLVRMLRQERLLAYPGWDPEPPNPV
jgi:hypothetical protein